ncbi:hypothetical protein [Variovorax dokdonensis]|uniref:hypothetical protein n=1 Tax=Variovorax dokdonensis TaxID=344883 RepID=UPI0036F21A55
MAALLVALAIVALLVGKQLGGSASPASSRAGSGEAMPQVPSGSPRQVEQQFKQSLDAAMQTPRPMPDEAR